VLSVEKGVRSYKSDGRKASLAEREEKRALPSGKKSEPCRAQKINGRISVSRQRPFYQATN